jgi:large subunit ribosomal protein L35
MTTCGFALLSTPNNHRKRQRLNGESETSCQNRYCAYLSRLMPKPISRSKTRKAVAKRFKITARGKVLRAQSSRRHLLGLKRAKRKRQLGKTLVLDKTDEARVKANLPFG